MSQAGFSRHGLGLMAQDGLVGDGYTPLRNSKHHYPFGCDANHCEHLPHVCRSRHCTAQLEQRSIQMDIKLERVMSELSETVSKYAALRNLIQARWGEVFITDPRRLEGGVAKIGVGTSALCALPEGECVSCDVELTRRLIQQKRLETGTYQARIVMLEEYQAERESDEEEYRSATHSIQTQIDASKNKLDSLHDGIKVLQQQVSLVRDTTRNGTPLPAGTISYDLWCRLQSTTIASDCKYQICTAEKDLAHYEHAVRVAEKRHERLWDAVGTKEGSKSTLDIAKERIKEQAARDSPFGRTGSYRGFGAGALKPRSHMNPNPKAAANQPEAAKAGKKDKKPKLVW